MNVTDLPDEGDKSGIFKFAMSFNGYDHFGSFEASADAAASGNRSSLALLRNELFFAARASRHSGDDHFVSAYQELLPFLRRYVSHD